MSRPKRYFTRLELIDYADSLGFKLELNANRILTLISKTDPDCWGTVTDLSNGMPVVGFRYYTLEGWKHALPANIERLEKLTAERKK